MTWRCEIIRAVLLAFGCMEMLLNAGYLIKKDGITKARKQHGELPENTSDSNMKIKVICMLLAGMMFFIIALASFVLHTYLYTAFVIGATVFCVYTISEAIYYRYWKTVGSALVSLVLWIVIYFSV